MQLKLGGRRKKLKWRAANGRHNKIRENRKNRPRMPTVGYCNAREIRGLVRGLNPVHISNAQDISKIGKNDIAIISRTLGRKKRIEIAEKAKGLKFLNFNPEKLLQEIKIEQEKKKQEKAPESKKEMKEKTKEIKNSEKAISGEKK